MSILDEIASPLTTVKNYAVAFLILLALVATGFVGYKLYADSSKIATLQADVKQSNQVIKDLNTELTKEGASDAIDNKIEKKEELSAKDTQQKFEQRQQKSVQRQEVIVQDPTISVVDKENDLSEEYIDNVWNEYCAAVGEQAEECSQSSFRQRGIFNTQK